MKPSKKQIVLVIVILELSTVLAAIMIHDAKIPPGKPGPVDDNEPVLLSRHDDSGKIIGSVMLSAMELRSSGLHIESIAPATIGKTIKLPGEIALDTNQQAFVTTPAQGRVLQILVKPGQAVKRGQTLAVLMNHELVTLQTRVAAAKDKVSLAQSNLERDRALWKRGVTTQQDLLQTDNALKLAQISYQNLAQQLRTYGPMGTSRDGRMLITATVDGHIAERDLTIGELAAPGTPLFTIANSDAPWVEFDVPPALSGQIGVGMTVKIESESRQPLTATIRGFRTDTEGSIRQLVARARIDSAKSGMSPEMLVTVYFTERNKSVTHAVKSSAIQTINQKSVIFIVDNDVHAPSTSRKPAPTRFKAITVKLGRVDPKGYSEVQTPLKAGTQYVSLGSFKLRAKLADQQNDEQPDQAQTKH